MANEFSGFDITVVNGSSRRIRATVTINDVAQNITDWSQLWFYAKDSLADADADAVITKTLTGGGIVMVNPGGGVVDITLDSIDTADLTNSLHWYYAELKGTDGDGALWIVRQGTLKVVPAVIEAIV